MATFSWHVYIQRGATRRPSYPHAWLHWDSSQTKPISLMLGLWALSNILLEFLFLGQFLHYCQFLSQWENWTSMFVLEISRFSCHPQVQDHHASLQRPLFPICAQRVPESSWWPNREVSSTLLIKDPKSPLKLSLILYGNSFWLSPGTQVFVCFYFLTRNSHSDIFCNTDICVSILHNQASCLNS